MLLLVERNLMEICEPARSHSTGADSFAELNKKLL
jgi:hypothetical protein